MTTLLQHMGNSIPVHVFHSKDKYFKNVLDSHSITLNLHEPISPLLASVRCSNAPIKLRSDSGKSDSAQSQQKVCDAWMKINRMFNLFEEEAFFLRFFQSIHSQTEELNRFIRNDKSELVEGYKAKEILGNAFSAALSSEDSKITLGINKGTFYYNDEPIVNSGYTSFVQDFTPGMFYFLGMKNLSYHIKEYDIQRNKAAIGTYEVGGPMNPMGDKIHIAQFKLIVLVGFIDLVCALVERLQLNLVETMPEVSRVLTLATQEKETLEHVIRQCFPSNELQEKDVMSYEPLRKSAAFQSIGLLGLGKDAESAFFVSESGQVLMEIIANTIGASRVLSWASKPCNSNYADDEIDPMYSEHRLLPNTKTRNAIQKLLDGLNDPNSLISYCFDAKTLRLNVAASSDYNSHTGEEYEREYIDICRGARYPIAQEQHVVRFVFDI